MTLDSKAAVIGLNESATRRENSNAVEGNYTLDDLLKMFGENIAKYLKMLKDGGFNNYIDFLSPEDVYDASNVTILMNSVRPILEQGVMLTNITSASMRNQQRIREHSMPIEPGSHLHGFSIEWLDNSHYALLASELYTGTRSAYDLALRLYTSYITNAPEKELRQFVSQTHTGAYGMQPGKITLVLDRNGKLAGPTKFFAGQMPNSLGVATPFGIPSTEITGCICFNIQDEQIVIEKISKFPFPIPVYNAEGKIIYPQST